MTRVGCISAEEPPGLSSNAEHFRNYDTADAFNSSLLFPRQSHYRRISLPTPESGFEFTEKDLLVEGQSRLKRMRGVSGSDLVPNTGYPRVFRSFA